MIKQRAPIGPIFLVKAQTVSLKIFFLDFYFLLLFSGSPMLKVVNLAKK
jgi:hypothetical protein